MFEVVDDIGPWVVKIASRPGPEGGAPSLRREFGALVAFRQALADVPDLDTAEPVEFIHGLEAYRMRRIEGTRFDHYVARRQFLRLELEEIAERLLYALTVFYEAVGEPYGDFHQRNVIVSPDGVLHLIDPTISDPFFAQPSRSQVFTPWELDVGYWVYSAVVRQVRSAVVRPRPAVRRLRFAAAMLDTLSQTADCGGSEAAMAVCSAHLARLVRDEPAKGAVLARASRPLLAFVAMARREASTA